LKPTRPIRVALLGSRGIPATYGGYETLMEELAPRLIARGFEVTVYCRSHYTPKGLSSHLGARLVVLPTIRSKHLDTPVHTFLSCLHAGREGYDAVLMVNSANTMFLPLLGGTPVALNVDGIEKRRAKWGAFGRAVYALSERLACFLPDALITDAEVIRRHYLARYGANSDVITYGVDPRPPKETGVLDRLGLRSRRYFLYVSRFEPENNPHRVAAAFGQVHRGADFPLVMVGGAPYAKGFIASFTEGADPRIRFPGPIYGEGYRELLSHAYSYIHATEVGGTHPALVEAMGYGNCVLLHDTPENREVAGGAARRFDAHRPLTLTAEIEWALAHPEEVVALRKQAAARARERFSWDAVADRYAALLGRLAGSTLE
jgi:glycosyltransferase involved in cell wall biosynthesis